jgi:hypothetical protein
MQCVFRSFDHAEAEIVANLLRSEGCPAHFFENGLSRLNWPYVIAYGGFRVNVTEQDRLRALDILDTWQRGEYSLNDGDDLHCPRCTSTSVEANPNYRGWAFVISQLLFGLPLVWPLKWRERCKACGFHWKAAPEQSYAELTAAADAALKSHA